MSTFKTEVRGPESTLRGSQLKSRLGIRIRLNIWPGKTQNQSQNQNQKDSETVLKPELTSGPVKSQNLTRNKVWGMNNLGTTIPTHIPRMDAVSEPESE